MASSSEDIQIFVKTLSTGTIKLDVATSNTISTVAKRCRMKIYDLFEGYDVDGMLACEQHFIFNGKPLDGDRTISDYNIQNESTLRIVFGLEGGSPKVIKPKKREVSKQEKLNALIKRISNEKPLMTEEFGKMIAAINECESLLRDLRSQEGFIITHAKTLSIDILEKAETMMQGNGQGGTEVKLQSMAVDFFPVINTVGESIDIMSKLYNNIINEFVKSYARGFYNAEKAGEEAVFDNKKFRQAIRDIINDKKVEEKVMNKIAEGAAGMQIG